MKLSRYLIAIALYIGCLPKSNAESINAVTIYIECTTDREDKPKKIRGTGVLVSKKGHVLTAKHVAGDDDYTCKGVQENPTLPTRGLIGDPRSMPNVDAALLQFIPGESETFPYVKFCRLDDSLKGKPIKARGFHKDSYELSVREGVISTINPIKGIIETDVHTAQGMSGGPVMLGDSSNLIGIVAGGGVGGDARSADPMYYGVLAAEMIAKTFELTEELASCKEPGKDIEAGKHPQDQVAITTTNLYKCKLGKEEILIDQLAQVTSVTRGGSLIGRMNQSPTFYCGAILSLTTPSIEYCFLPYNGAIYLFSYDHPLGPNSGGTVGAVVGQCYTCGQVKC